MALALRVSMKRPDRVVADQLQRAFNHVLMDATRPLA
jgi:hypothetical protein